MARYKVLKSVAHSVAHSFTSSLNYRDDDYVLGHILRRARETGHRQLRFSLLTNHAEPESLLIPPVRDSIESYRKWFPPLVESHKTSMDVVRSAVITLTFDLQRGRPKPGQPRFEESPYVIAAEITDDRGKVWSAQLQDWWYPEAGEIATMPPAQVPEPRTSRFEQFMRSIWPW